MQEEPNIVKEILFDYIKKSEPKIRQQITENNFKGIIHDIIENCYEKIIPINTKEEVLGVLATGILHYLLTNALISSQRKVIHEGIELDIVIPDLKTLINDPKKSLIISIPKSNDKNFIQNKLDEIKKVQPIDENIWLVLDKEASFKNKTFVIKKEESSFSNIIYDVSQFTNLSGQNKLKIFKIS